MTRERIAKLATILVIAGAFGIAIARRTNMRPQPQPDAAPQDTIYKMFDAARAGDVGAYLARYSGQMRNYLNEAVIEKGKPAFSTYLKSSNAEIKGLVVFEPRPVSEGSVQVRVEYVYRDRNEAQTMFLEKRPGGWAIVRIDGEERIKTLVPYGTPVQ